MKDKEPAGVASAEMVARAGRVRFDDRVEQRAATLLQMQTALARTGVRGGGSAGGEGAAGGVGGGAAVPPNLLDLPPVFWEYTDDSTVKLLRTSKTLRLALERQVPGNAERGRPTMSVRLNREWYDALGSAPSTARIETVLAELARTSHMCSITTLELTEMLLDGTEAGLAAALAVSTGLTRLSLTDCRIREAGCGRLAEALLPCTKLVQLDLGRNEIGDGVALIADVLPRLPVLQDVTLNKSGPDFAGRDSGERLAQALTQCTALTRLNVRALFGSADGFPMEPVIRALPGCLALRELDLSFNTCDAVAGDAAATAGATMLAQSLARCTNLKHLELAACRLGDATVVALGQANALTGLTRLNLRSNPLQSAGIGSLQQSLPQCTALRELELEANGNQHVLIALTSALAECPALRSLHATRFEIGKQGCREILEALRGGTSLTELDMQRCPSEVATRSGDFSMAVGLAEVLGAWPRLKKLNISMCGVQDRHLRRLVETDALTALTDLNLNTNKFGGDGAVTALAFALTRLTALRSLDVSSNQLHETSVVALLRALPACSLLTSLDLSSSAVSGEQWQRVVATLLDVLPRCPRLRELDLTSHFRSTIAPGDVERLRQAWLSVRGRAGPTYEVTAVNGNQEYSCAGLRFSVYVRRT